MSRSEPCIIVIGAGILTVPLIRRAREMGVETIVMDGNADAPGMAIADHPVTISTRDVDGTVERALELAGTRSIDGVVTAGADVERTVARVAHALGLPGPTPNAAFLCNHKVAMRSLLADTGIPGPDFAEVKSAFDAARRAGTLGYPLIVKPMDNCGSRGVVRVDSAAQLGEAVENAIALSGSGSALLEEFVEGSTHTVEMISHRGEIQLCSIIDTHHGFAPFAVELRHVNPSQLDPEAQTELFDRARETLRCVGIQDGAAKVDFLFPAEGPKVMEMTARLSGGFHCQHTTPLAHGTDNLRAAIDVCMGRPPRRKDVEPRHKKVAVCHALFPTPGRIVSIEGVEEARAIPGIEEVYVLAKPGDVIQSYESSADRRFFVIACANSLDECDEAVRWAESVIQISTEA